MQKEIFFRTSNSFRMNVYDFDNTILRGDSTGLFFVYCLFRTPRMWLTVPKQAVNAFLFLTKRRKKQDFKERMLSFLTLLPDVDKTVERFWQTHFSRVKAFYPLTQREDDVVISASPEFLIRPACDRLGIRCVMGSPVDKHTGKYSGLNCHGAEKVRRFREVYPDAQIEEFYSDSHSDDPLAHISQTAYLVKGDKLLPWDPVKK